MAEQDVLSEADRAAIENAKNASVSEGHPDLNGFYDLFEHAVGDLPRTLAIIDAVHPWWTKNIINIAAYVNQDDPDILPAICEPLEDYFCEPLARLDTCDEYLEECLLGGLGRFVY